MNSDTAEQENGPHKLPERWLLVHYFEALNVLFRIENALRVFVYTVLTNDLKDKWLQAAVESDDSEKGTIDSISKRRVSQANRFGYLGYAVSCPIMQLTSGELIRIMTSEAYWKLFASFFPASKEIVKNKLDEIGTIRNALAHFRPLKADDVEVVKQNANQAFSKVEQCLNELLHCNNVVPTNTSDVWYAELRTLKAANCEVQLFQSKDESWVNIQIIYRPPVVVQSSFPTHRSYRTLRLRSPRVIRESGVLAKEITYLSEYVYSGLRNDELDHQKKLNLVFSRRTIEAEFLVITKAIGDTLQLIEKETALIGQDHLARGRLIETATITAGLTKTATGSYWVVDDTAVQSTGRAEDPPEYWGELPIFNTDFLAKTERYPWMPTDVSAAEFPF